MATKLNVSAEEAIEELNRLLVELTNVQDSIKKTGTHGKKSFKTVQKATDDHIKAVTSLSRQLSVINSILVQNAAAMSKAADASAKTAASTSSADNAYKRLSESVKRAKSDAQSLILTKTKENAETKRAIAYYKLLKKELDQVSKEIDGVDKSQKKAKKSSSDFTKALSLAAIITFGRMLFRWGKQLFNAIRHMDSLRYAIDKITDSAWEYRVSVGFLISLTRDFGVELSSTAERWNKFLAAAKQSGLSLKDTEDIFRSMTKAGAVLGLSTDELRSVYLALEQMLSKGKITTEELRRQLGERLPGAMGIMAASMGVSIDVLDKMMKKGEVLSSEVLPGFAEAVEIAFGIQNVEKVENLNASVGRLSGAWDLFIFNLAEGESAFAKAVQNVLENLTEVINYLTFLTGDDNQKLRLDVVSFDKEASDMYKNQAMEIIDTREGLNNELDRLNKEFQEANDDFQEAVLKEDKDRTQLVLDEKNKALVDYGKKIKIEEKEIAKDRLNTLQATADKQEKIWKEGLDEIEALRQEDLKNQGKYTKMISDSSIGRFFKRNFGDEGETIEEKKAKTDEAQISYAWTLAQLDLTKKILQESEKIEKIEEQKQVRGRQIRMAKDYAETNKYLINDLKEQIRLSEKLTKDEIGGLEERMHLLGKMSNAKNQILNLEEEDALRAADTWIENERLKLEQNLSAHKEHAENYKLQQAQNAIQEKNNLEKLERDKQLILQKYRQERVKVEEETADILAKITEDTYDLSEKELLVEKGKYLKVLQDKLEAVKKGSNEEKQLILDIKQIEIDYHNLVIDNRISQLKKEMDVVKTLGEKLRILTEIEGLEAQKKEGVNLDLDENKIPIISDSFAKEFSKWANASQELNNALFGLADAVFERRIQNIQKEIDAEEAKYDRLLELAKDDAEETKIIERNKAIALEKLEEKKRKEQVKQAKLDKKMRLMQAITGTAVAVVQAMNAPPPVGFILAAIAAAAGAVQIATIASTPIPEFKEGGVMGYDGKALINDGGKQEYVERGGKILTTGKQNAVVDLMKGDIIHKDFETLQRKSLLLSLMAGGNSVTEKELNLAFGIKEEIRAGFKKARIESKVVVINKNDDYRRKMSMWD